MDPCFFFSLAGWFFVKPSVSDLIFGNFRQKLPYGRYLSKQDSL